jgi:hypothetical protein
MKITITPIAVATIAPAALAAVAASVMPFAQAAPALASAPVAAHHAVSPAHAAAATHSAKTHLDGRTRPAGHHHAKRHHARHHQATADQHAQAAAAQSQPSQVSQPTAAESSFEQCVAWRESGNNPTDPDGLFGILPSTWAQLGYSGTAGQASVAVQQQAFNRLYAEYGSQPWAPSDGC